MFAIPKLTPQQKLYAHWLALGLCETEAAACAGLSEGQAARARAALDTDAGQDYLRTVQQAVENRAGRSARDGYYRLAFGDVSDALSLVLQDSGEAFTLPAQPPDLFNVSEIRRGKNGIELRFFDRLEALDRLAALETAGDPAGSFYDALLKSALPPEAEEEHDD